MRRNKTAIGLTEILPRSGNVWSFCRSMNARSHEYCSRSKLEQVLLRDIVFFFHFFFILDLGNIVLFNVKAMVISKGDDGERIYEMGR